MVAAKQQHHDNDDWQSLETVPHTKLVCCWGHDDDDDDDHDSVSREWELLHESASAVL